MAPSSNRCEGTRFGALLTAALAVGLPTAATATGSVPAFHPIPHRLHLQADPPAGETDTIPAFAEPDFLIGDHVSLGIGAGTVGSSLRGVDGPVDEREFRVLALGRAGTRWRGRFAVAVELTGSYGHHQSVAVTRDSTFTSPETIPELEMAGAAVFCYTVSPRFPLTVYGGPVCDVVWAWFDASLVGGQKFRNISNRSAALGYVAGADFDWHRLRRRGAMVFVQYQRTYHKRYVYERLAPGLDGKDRWSVMGGLGLTFRFR